MLLLVWLYYAATVFIVAAIVGDVYDQLIARRMSEAETTAAQ